MIIKIKNPYRFYVYLWLREKCSQIDKAGTVRYVGKGQGNRAYRKGCPKDKSNIIIFQSGLLKEEAFYLEECQIKKYGRIDIGTGILRNRTNGGEGISGKVWSEEERTNQKNVQLAISKEKRLNINKKMAETVNNKSDEEKEAIKKRQQYVHTQFDDEKYKLRNEKSQYTLKNKTIDEKAATTKKRQDAHKGKKVSIETREKQSNTLNNRTEIALQVTISKCKETKNKRTPEQKAEYNKIRKNISANRTLEEKLLIVEKRKLSMNKKSKEEEIIFRKIAAEKLKSKTPEEKFDINQKKLETRKRNIEKLIHNSVM